ncbi:hypothetical protein [Ilyobacter polytropus]|nr:hypothetical protein [Ilyobacter polytropus]
MKKLNLLVMFFFLSLSILSQILIGKVSNGDTLQLISNGEK